MLRNLITVGFGESLPSNSSAGEVKQAVLKTSIHAWQEYSQTLEPLAISFLRTAKSQRKKMIVMDATTELSYERLLMDSIRQTVTTSYLLLLTSAGAERLNTDMRNAFKEKSGCYL